MVEKKNDIASNLTPSADTQEDGVVSFSAPAEVENTKEKKKTTRKKKATGEENSSTPTKKKTTAKKTTGDGAAPKKKTTRKKKDSDEKNNLDLVISSTSSESAKSDTISAENVIGSDDSLVDNSAQLTENTVTSVMDNGVSEASATIEDSIQAIDDVVNSDTETSDVVEVSIDNVIEETTVTLDDTSHTVDDVINSDTETSDVVEVSIDNVIEETTATLDDTAHTVDDIVNNDTETSDVVEGSIDNVIEETTVTLDDTAHTVDDIVNNDTETSDVVEVAIDNAIEETTASNEIIKNTSAATTDAEKTITLKKVSDSVTTDSTAPKRKTKFWKKLLASLIVIILAVALIVGSLGGYYVYNTLQSTPDLVMSDFISQESSIVYDSEGEVISELGAYLRENVTYEELPTSVIDAFISIEDSRYFTHPGFDIPRFTKAFIENLKTMSFEQGGSTFTMQLVKNTYFTLDDINNSVLADKSIPRKLQEIYLSLKLETEMSKEDIFINYLNKLNFGGNIRGIQKGALYYFGKNVSELNLSEAALLSGIVNLPNAYNPYTYLDRATERRNTVLDLMAYHGYISKEECDLAKAINVEDLLIGEDYTYSNTDSSYQSYLDTVIQEAIELTGKDPALASMKIYTYMDRDVQDVMDGIQNGTVEIPFPDDLMQIAMVSIDNSTGAIVAIGGGRNYEGARLLNRATSGFKQPGSAVKPFLSYALAFEHLYWSSNHVLTDRPITYRGGSLVLKNFDGQYRGDVTLQQAVGQSLNIPAIEALQAVIDEIGKEEVVKYLQTIGFTKVTEENFDTSYAIGGTSYETTVLEMAGAHAMLINNGIYNEPHTIQKIVLQDGTTIYPENQSVKALSSGAAYQAAQLMRYCVEGPYFNYMQILKRDYAVYAKTGTTDWGSDGLVYNIPRGAAKDKWMVSSTTNYTTAVWVGYDKGVKDKGTYFNSYKSSLNLTGRISSLLLDTLHEDEEDPSDIVRPDDIETISYVLGSWPYAYLESWMDPSISTTTEIRKGHPELVSIQNSLDASSLSSELAGIDVSVLEDGTLTVTWHASGRCANGTKDLTLNDGINYIAATGACILDPAILFGSPHYYATVYINDVPIHEISSDNGYYYGWPGEIYGSVKVCGGFSTTNGSSNTICSTPK
ncbi:MAG: transglycosylase domain-containing protein [Anaerorhabdus sp.]